MQAQWFESWFDSPWYPILYSHRDHAEAEAFITHLLGRLAPAPEARFLDLACGRGRHSVYIHRHGYDVTGLDLSAASIADAQAHAGAGLRFGVQDMRDPLPGSYDFILNLFTSFGYFDSLADNRKVLQNVAAGLLPQGTFVLDFFNAADVLRRLVAHETVQRGTISFDIRRSHVDGHIVKDIRFEDGGEAHHFQERVQAIDLATFEEMFAAAGLQVVETWGDYAGHTFDVAHSPRLILFARHAPTRNAQ